MVSEEDHTHATLRIGKWLPYEPDTDERDELGRIYQTGSPEVSASRLEQAELRARRSRRNRLILAGFALTALFSLVGNFLVNRGNVGPSTWVAEPPPVVSLPDYTFAPASPPAATSSTSSSPSAAGSPSSEQPAPAGSSQPRPTTPGKIAPVANEVPPAANDPAVPVPDPTTAAPEPPPAPAPPPAQEAPPAPPAPPAEESDRTVALTVGATVGLEPSTRPGRRVRADGRRVRVDSVGSSSSAGERADTRFVVRPGRADSSCLSFESAERPGRFLRHQNYAIVLHEVERRSSLYDKDTTFCPVAGLSGRGSSLRSLNYPDRYLSERDSSLFIDRANGDGSRRAATFAVRPPL